MYWVTGILGLALLVAPFVLGFSDHTAALWASLLLGGAITLVSVVKALAQDAMATWEYWIAAIAGVVAVVAPFLLGFSDHAAALWTSLLLGTAVAALAGYQVFFAEAETHPTHA
ncbi:MAG: SPW repeat protein [Chloroflexi bacterium]|nr:SPW repeat protein [Chloroflexota bacterium]